MAHMSDEMEDVCYEYYLALGNMMDQVLHVRHWKQTIASDLNSAIDRARTNLVKASSTARVECDYEILPLLTSDFSKTMEMVEKLSKIEEIRLERREDLLNQARVHRDYLYSQVIPN